MGNFTVINVVSEYSADNTGATDTSTQINNALAAVPVGVTPNIAQGAIVYFPKGTYLIQKPHATTGHDVRSRAVTHSSSSIDSYEELSG